MPVPWRLRRIRSTTPYPSRTGKVPSKTLFADRALRRHRTRRSFCPLCCEVSSALLVLRTLEGPMRSTIEEAESRTLKGHDRRQKSPHVVARRFRFVRCNVLPWAELARHNWEDVFDGLDSHAHAVNPVIDPQTMADRTTAAFVVSRSCLAPATTLPFPPTPCTCDCTLG